MDVSAYQAKVYPSPPCWPLVADVLMTERGITVDVCKTVTGSLRTAASLFRLELHKGAHGFEQVQDPVDFAVVLMGKTNRLGVHHCGIFYDGKVLHALDTGTLHQDLITLHEEYEIVEYWSKA